MRIAAAGCALAILVFLAVFGAVLAQKATSTNSAANRAAATTPAPAPAARVAPAEVARTVTIPEPLPPAAATGPVLAAASQRAPANTAPPPAAAPAPSAAGAPPAAPTPAPVPPNPVPAAAPPPTAPQAACPGNPNALGIGRVVELDTTGGPGFGFEHFKTHDFLRPGEVVLTFDDGPWPKHTPAVLAALAAHCTKAIFFPIGLHATYEPGILKQVAAA